MAAIAGSILSVASGIAYGDLPRESGTELVPYLDSRPSWYVPLIGAGFVVGAILWLLVFDVVARSARGTGGEGLAHLALLTVVVGVVVHLVDSAVAGAGMAGLVGAAERDRVASAELILDLHDGLWASVIALFHGLPFVLLGAALARGRVAGAWFGVVGSLIGLASFLYGSAMFVDPGDLPQAPYAVLGLLLAVWMTALGIVLLRRPSA